MAHIYGLGIYIALFAGALSFVGYIAAIIIGGETATDICRYIYKEIYPIVFQISSISVLIGLVKMYIAGEKTMVPSKKQ